MRKIVKRIKKNIYIWSQIKNFIYLFDKKEMQYERFVKAIGKIDSIKDYDLFVNMIEKILPEKEMQINRRNEKESHLYGHYKALTQYAGLKNHNVSLIPALNHGICFSSHQWECSEDNLCYACQGKNRISQVHKINPWKPIFALGPYIHYAESYYPTDKCMEIKREMGKTLLVFPSHTYEGSKIKREETFVEMIYKKYSSIFDSIMVCIYWHDVNDPFVKDFKKRGAKLVSAGFRGDENFIKRLKTIIKLADTIVVDGIGTNIGYCIYMNKPIYMEEGEKPNFDDIRLLDNYYRFKKAFHSKTLDFTQEQFKLQKELYNEFWGGESCIKSREEVKIIFELLKEIYHLAHYNTEIIPKIIERKLEFWKKSSSRQDNIKYFLLRDSIGI